MQADISYWLQQGPHTQTDGYLAQKLIEKLRTRVEQNYGSKATPMKKFNAVIDLMWESFPKRPHVFSKPEGDLLKVDSLDQWGKLKPLEEILGSGFIYYDTVLFHCYRYLRQRLIGSKLLTNEVKKKLTYLDSPFDHTWLPASSENYVPGNVAITFTSAMLRELGVPCRVHLPFAFEDPNDFVRSVRATPVMSLYDKSVEGNLDGWVFLDAKYIKHPHSTKVTTERKKYENVFGKITRENEVVRGFHVEEKKGFIGIKHPKYLEGSFYLCDEDVTERFTEVCNRISHIIHDGHGVYKSQGLFIYVSTPPFQVYDIPNQIFGDDSSRPKGDYISGLDFAHLGLDNLLTWTILGKCFDLKYRDELTSS